MNNKNDTPDSRFEVIPVPGLPEFTPGDDVGAIISAAVKQAGFELTGTDVVVVASKAVAKAQGCFDSETSREAVIDAQTIRVVAQREISPGRVTRVVQTRSGPVLAAAGVDSSDVTPGTVLRLPEDPDASARAIRAALPRDPKTNHSPAVIVSDTSGRPWRIGVSDFALGAAGLVCVQDVRGQRDRFGRPLGITIRAIADEISAAADLARGKATGFPVALIRGLGWAVTAEDGQGAAGCVRTGPTDWFSHGKVEAVRASLGVGVDEVASPPLSPETDSTESALRRAVAVAFAGPGAAIGVNAQICGNSSLTLSTQSGAGDQSGSPAANGAPTDSVELARSFFALGQAFSRLEASLWAEGLRVCESSLPVDSNQPRIVVSIRPTQPESLP